MTRARLLQCSNLPMNGSSHIFIKLIPAIFLTKTNEMSHNLKQQRNKAYGKV